jgi:hypothetical protein
VCVQLHILTVAFAAKLLCRVEGKRKCLNGIVMQVDVCESAQTRSSRSDDDRYEAVEVEKIQQDPVRNRIEMLSVTWLILPAVICLFQRLSHACLRISLKMVSLRTAHYNSHSLLDLDILLG